MQLLYACDSAIRHIEALNETKREHYDLLMLHGSFLPRLSRSPRVVEAAMLQSELAGGWTAVS